MRYARPWKNKKKGGWSKTREYSSWRMMQHRCLNPDFDGFPKWGGRGIKVCCRWLNFENFLTDMGPRPPGTSLDRINNDGHYEPGNCRWETDAVQAGNRRSSKLLTIDGKTMNIKRWADKTGINYSCLRHRVGTMGMEPKDAIAHPSMKMYKKQKRTKKMTAMGRTMLLTDWALELGVTYKFLQNRIKTGWDPDLIVSVPPHGKRWKALGVRRGDPLP